MRRVLMLLVLLGACSGDDDDGGGGGGPPDGAAIDDPDAAPGDATCSPGREQARFAVSSTASSGGAGGHYDDRAYPAPALPEVEAGGCTFVGSAGYFCDPVCEFDQVCGANGCAALPVALSVGTLHVAGTSPELDLEPNEWNVYNTTENYPGLYQPGDQVTVSGGGGHSEVPSFSLTVRGVPELTVPFESLTATEHQDMTVPWNLAADAPAGSQVVIHMDSDHHGAPGHVECWADDDDGELVVPAAVIDPLIQAGESGIGTYIENVYMMRVNRTTADTDRGCAALESEHIIYGVAVETVRAE